MAKIDKTKYRDFTAVHCYKVYDGDTIYVDIDLGFDLWIKKQKIRLLGIDTPEVRGVEREQGIISRDWVREKILGKMITLRVYQNKKKGKYGRWLAEVFMEGENLNEKLVEEGLAKPYMI